MKFKILRDFRGSQDGVTVEKFAAGTEVEISEHLAPHIGAWAEPVDGDAVPIENKAVITDGKPHGKPKLKRAG